MEQNELTLDPDKVEISPCLYCGDKMRIAGRTAQNRWLAQHIVEDSNCPIVQAIVDVVEWNTRPSDVKMELQRWECDSNGNMTTEKDGRYVEFSDVVVLVARLLRSDVKMSEARARELTKPYEYLDGDCLSVESEHVIRLLMEHGTAPPTDNSAHALSEVKKWIDWRWELCDPDETRILTLLRDKITELEQSEPKKVYEEVCVWTKMDVPAPVYEISCSADGDGHDISSLHLPPEYCFNCGKKIKELKKEEKL